MRWRTIGSAAGEARVFQREEDGLWVSTVSMGYDGEGKRLRKTVYGNSKAEIQKKLDDLRTEAGSLTVGQLLDRWLTNDEQKSAVRTHEERERLIRVHLKPRLGGVKLAKLNALHIEGLYADMHRDEVGPFAIRSAADVLSIALNAAVRLKLISSNPSAAVKKPKTPKREMLCLDDSQAKAVLTAAAGAPVGPLVVVALGTGCRQGELLALTWEDVDLKAGTLTVRRSLAQTKAGFVTKEPKTNASRRTLTLPGFVVEALTALKALRLKVGLLDKPMFSTRTGGYLCKKNVLRAFRGVVAKANKSIRSATEKENALPGGPALDGGRGEGNSGESPVPRSPAHGGKSVAIERSLPEGGQPATRARQPDNDSLGVCPHDAERRREVGRRVGPDDGLKTHFFSIGYS